MPSDQRQAPPAASPLHANAPVNKVDGGNTNQTSALTHALARKETRAVNVLRVCVLGVLIFTAALVSAGVYLYTRNQEESAFAENFQDSAHQVIDSFHGAVERNLAATASLSKTITLHAQQSNIRFPFVTLPDFEMYGSDVRAQSGSHLIHWCPLVTDDNREEWEAYANSTRFHATESFQKETQYRIEQDLEFGYNQNRRNLDGHEDDGTPRELQRIQGSRPTTLQDGTFYHPHIWSNGAKLPPGDIPSGKGKYLPLWQQSPADARLQSALNIDVSTAVLTTDGLIETMESEQTALLNAAASPLESSKAQFEYYLSLSQYRHSASELVDDYHTIMSYPVFDSFDKENKQLAGILTTDIYWKILFSNLLPSNLQGIICVIENSLNQTFAYRIDGQTATALGMNYDQDPKYNDLEISTNINTHLSNRASPENRAYKTVHLSDTVQYTIRVYPSEATEDGFITQQPLLYTIVTLFGFLFASCLFLAYSYTVERRQRIMIASVIAQVHKAADTERELNEFLSHEIRNPLSAAISACTFVSTAVNEADPLTDEESRNYVREDIEVVNSSLHFINDFMRSMLDIYRADGNHITVAKAPVDIKQDILMPVSNILYKRLSTYDVIVDCPEHLVIMTDSIRLKQVLINLVRNSSKFVEVGFLRMRAEIDEHNQVRILVEDSGPGISSSKKQELFGRYQESLDLLSQGTGIGLNLSKKLMHIMGGDLYLNDNYHSGIEGKPGACFVVDLQTSPLDLNAELDNHHADLEAGLPPNVESDVVDMIIPPPTDGTGGPKTEAKIVEEQSLFRVDDTTRTESPVESTSSNPILFAIEEKKSEVPDDNNAAPQPIPVSRPPPPPPPARPSGAVEEEPELPEDIGVLFVDDDAMLRKLFMRAVKRVAPASWKVQEASSGEMALKVCESAGSEETELPDIIFMDQYMASVDKQLLGTETTLALRQLGVTSRICGLSANDLRDAFINSGADDFILKPMPCKPPELKKVLMKILTDENYVTRHGLGGSVRSGRSSGGG